MSANYKTIRQTREAVKDLKSQGWADSKIAKHIGVSISIIQDIVDIDEVAMNIREPTIVKFRAFLDTLEKKKPKKEDPPPKEPVLPAPDVPEDAAPVIQWVKVQMPEDLLDQLNEIAGKLASKGYRLDCQITLQHSPE